MLSISHLWHAKILIVSLLLLSSPTNSMQMVRELIKRTSAQSTPATRTIGAAVIGSSVLNYLERQRDMRIVDESIDQLKIDAPEIEDHIRKELKTLGVPFWQTCVIARHDTWASLATKTQLILLIPQDEVRLRLSVSDTHPFALLQRGFLAHEAGHLHELHTHKKSLLETAAIPGVYFTGRLMFGLMAANPLTASVAAACTALSSNQMIVRTYMRYNELRADDYIPNDPAVLRHTADFTVKFVSTDPSWLATHPSSQQRAERLVQRAKQLESGTLKRRSTFDPETNL